mmetsp:Transcript_23481/g.33625  ORF Transcript_23481/g.33625 Transcript_23481/m.33625 type:complete len:126 (-) Transcript_23481:84-461(-)
MVISPYSSQLKVAFYSEITRCGPAISCKVPPHQPKYHKGIQRTYLNQLINDETIAAFSNCLDLEHHMAVYSVESFAGARLSYELLPDGYNWLLSGKKSFKRYLVSVNSFRRSSATRFLVVLVLLI